MNNLTYRYNNPTTSASQCKHNQMTNTLYQREIIETKSLATFDFLSSVNTGKTLFVGEGNFSFSLSIIRQLKAGQNIITTTIENSSEFSDLTIKNIKALHTFGVKVFCKIDATKIDRYFMNHIFGNIIFQFPHTGNREVVKGRNSNFILLCNFLRSSSKLLSYSGKVVISIVDSPYYRGIFQIEEAAKITGYKKLEFYPFNPLCVPGYVHTMTNEESSAISKNDKLMTIVFRR